jgi:hypothetical protein
VTVILFIKTVTKYMSAGKKKKTVSEFSLMDLEGTFPLWAASGDLAAHHPTLQRMRWRTISVADTRLESRGERPMAIYHYTERWFAHLTPVLDRGLCRAFWAQSSLEVLLGSFLQLVESTPCQTTTSWFLDPQRTVS